jgi:alkanesulfonate monooxygenase
MSINVHWFLPTGGDSRDVDGSAGGHVRPPTLSYLGQVAQAAEDVGFDAVLTPVGSWCEDPWTVTAYLAARTERLRFIVAVRPGTIVPTLAAQMAATLQRASNGRVLLNVVSGGEEDELRRYGDWLDKEARYERTGEFLAILRGAFEGPVDFEGRHLRAAGATAGASPAPRPELHFGGTSSAALRMAARHADVHLSWGEPIAALAERIERLRALAAELGRSLRFGLRIHVITRDRADEAWAETDRLLDAMDPEVVAAVTRAQARSGSAGQRRMAELHGGSRDDLVLAPNVWSGIGLVRGGVGTALVGSHEEVADRIAEYHAIGFDEFILSGHPHLEEAYAAGEGLLPVLRRRGLLPEASAAEARPRGPAFVAAPVHVR